MLERHLFSKKHRAINLENPLESETVLRYLQKHARLLKDPTIAPEPTPALQLCIVIPAMAESARLFDVLDSLQHGNQRTAEAEVIVVVNSGINAGEHVFKDNQKTLDMLRARLNQKLAICVLDCASPGRRFDPKQAGAGLARRLGMDWALFRLSQVKKITPGVIACLDADSPVSSGYIDRLLEHFSSGRIDAGLCKYEHPLPEDESTRRAIIQYELWLKYFELGMTIAGSPYAATPIGSCMAVSAVTYAAVDGMPVCQAGEDFYFWQKIVKMMAPERVALFDDITVYPSARVSDRMVFGTSRAMHRILTGDQTAYRQVDRARAFLILKEFFRTIAEGYQDPLQMIGNAADCLSCFLEREKAGNVFRNMQRVCPTAEHFRCMVHQWFDGLKSIRFIHTYTAQYGKQDIIEAIHELATTVGLELPNMETLSDAGKIRAQLGWLRELSMNQFNRQIPTLR